MTTTATNDDTAALPDGVWEVDRQRSEIGFAAQAAGGLQTVRGEFGALAGTLAVRAGRATGRLTIEAGSVDTGNARRDRHLRSPTFLDAERHPRIAFAATAVSARDGGLTVEGELARGSARAPIAIPVTVEHAGDGTLRLEGETTVSRAAVGMTWNVLGVIRDAVGVRAHLTLARAAT